ncbi:MAG: formyl transferase [Nitrospirota bacterium]|nr:formyl transferase [Nitrospirota bacterium]
MARIVLFTRTGFHHTCFINRMQERFQIACVVREAYPRDHQRRKIPLTTAKKSLGRNGINGIRDIFFLKKFHKTYSAGFGYHPALKDCLQAQFDSVVERRGTEYLNIECGGINSNEFASFIRDLRPDIIAVLGSSVIKPHIISIPSMAIINIHSGLSPYYRGTWSYGWPIVNNEPEYIGVTLHHINPGIDTGDIIYQTRPLLEGRDDLNTIFLKVISEGMELAVKAIEELSETGGIKSYRQPPDTGLLYLSKDFNADAARLCLANLQSGIIRRYNSGKEARDSGTRLYGYVPPCIHNKPEGEKRAGGGPGGV